MVCPCFLSGLNRRYPQPGRARACDKNSSDRITIALQHLGGACSAWASPVAMPEAQITLYKYGPQWGMPSICPGCMTAEVIRHLCL